MQPSLGGAAGETSPRELRRELLAERAARERADRAVSRLSVLLQITGRLAEAADEDGVARAVVEIAATELDADSTAVCRLDADRQRFVVLASDGMDAATVSQWQEFPLEAPLPACDAVRDRRPIFLHSIADRDARYPALRGHPAAHALYAVLPLVVHDRSVGALALGWAAGKDISERDLPLLSAVAQQAAQALDRARLFASERAARAAAEAAAEQARAATERVSLLAEVGAGVGSTLEPATALRRLVRALLPSLADQTSAYLLEDDTVRFVELAHVRPDLEAVARELAREAPQRLSEPRLAEVVASGRTRVVPVVDDAAVAAVGETHEQRARLRSLGIRSLAIVPLVARSRRLGVLICALSVSGRRYVTDDAALLDEIGRRAGVALDNARTHQALSETAHTLQQSLLPTRLPTLPGVQLAARYHSAGDGTAPGGDVYDAWQLDTPDGSLQYGVLVADVSGKGVRAAALTSSVRHTARAVSHGSARPSDVLRRVSDALRSTDGGEAFCTAAYLVVTPPSAPGRPALVELALGGSPQPLLRRSGGGVEPVGRPGTALGLFTIPELSDAVVDLRPGDVLAIPTDGYLEARAPDGSFADGLLQRLLGEGDEAADAAAIARNAERAIVLFQHGHPRDDMALVVLRAASG